MLEKLGKYRIDGVLGSGAMGIVYKAFDINIERRVALKTIHTDLLYDASGEELVARFKTEAQASGRLMHPGIVAIYDYGEIDRTAYLAMEFVSGVTLNSILDVNTPAEFSASISFMRQLLLALEYAHGRGVVHRDIKPANLMVTEDLILKITDFGIARLESSNLTQVGSVMGTPSYMSPEQLRGEAVDARTDIFSAGIVLFQLLAGRHPFVGSTTKVMEQIQNEKIPNISVVNSAIAPSFDPLMQKALAKNRMDRYQSAREFLDALEEICQANIAENDEFAEKMNDRTILAIKTAVGRLRHSDVPPPLLTTPNSISLTTLTPWKIDIAPDLQTLLAKQVGPMARLILKNALAQADNIDELCKKLIPHIPSEKGRAEFLLGVQKAQNKLLDRKTGSGISNQSVLTPASITASAKNATSSPGWTELPKAQSGLDSQALEKVEKILTLYMGPIAKILVRKAAQQTTDRRAFFQLLAEKLPTEAERTKFLREIEVGV